MASVIYGTPGSGKKLSMPTAPNPSLKPQEQPPAAPAPKKEA